MIFTETKLKDAYIIDLDRRTDERVPRLRHVAHGVLDLDPTAPLSRRLADIAEGLNDVILQHRPTVGSVESGFFHKDAPAAAKTRFRWIEGR